MPRPILRFWNRVLALVLALRAITVHRIIRGWCQRAISQTLSSTHTPRRGGPNRVFNVTVCGVQLPAHLTKFLNREGVRFRSTTLDRASYRFGGVHAAHRGRQWDRGKKQHRAPTNFEAKLLALEEYPTDSARVGLKSTSRVRDRATQAFPTLATVLCVISASTRHHLPPQV